MMVLKDFSSEQLDEFLAFFKGKWPAASELKSYAYTGYGSLGFFEAA